MTFSFPFVTFFSSTHGQPHLQQWLNKHRDTESKAAAAVTGFAAEMMRMTTQWDGWAKRMSVANEGGGGISPASSRPPFTCQHFALPPLLSSTLSFCVVVMETASDSKAYGWAACRCREGSVALAGVTWLTQNEWTKMGILGFVI